MRQLLSILLGLFSVSALAAGSVRLDFVAGPVSIVASGGQERSASRGAAVVPGETVRTGSEGRAQLRFDDGAVVSLQPNSDFRIDDYRFSGASDGQERALFTLLRGGLRTLTGIVGRSQRESYRMTTSVATIGIRGTEYTLAYLDSDAIAVATGEGAIEVCNGSGCSTLASGDSAVVRGRDGEPRRVAFRPRLDPTPPPPDAMPLFASMASRRPDGSVNVNQGNLQSGPGYAFQGAHGNVVVVSTMVDGVASLADGNQLTHVASGSNFFQSLVAGESSGDGVMGWGRWASATDQASSTLTDLHYVVGQPTPSAGLTALSGTTVTYSNIVGATTPTCAGCTGTPTFQGPSSGSLTAVFGAATMQVSMSLDITMNASPMTITATTGSTPVPIASTFTWDPGYIYSGTSGSGQFSGVNASHAGATYSTYAGGGFVSGAVVLSR